MNQTDLKNILEIGAQLRAKDETIKALRTERDKLLDKIDALEAIIERMQY